MIKKIYLDMDGVLCNFEQRFIERYGAGSIGMRDRKNFTENWPDFIKTEQFKTLEWFPGAKELLELIEQYDVEVEILSSSGGEKFHSQVTMQKITWLCNNGIPYKANIVPGRKHKAEYATPDSIMIDDTEDVITSFNAAGGIGIHHKDVSKTLETLRTLLK